MALDKKERKKTLVGIISRWLDTSGPGLPLHLLYVRHGVAEPFYQLSTKKGNGRRLF